MSSRFLSRAQKDLTRKLGQILFEIKDPRLDGNLAISRVVLSADLSHLKVYVVINEAPERQKEMLGALRAAVPFLRRRVGESISLRKTPDLHVFHDQTPEDAAHIESILAELKASGQLGEDEPSPDAGGDDEDDAEGDGDWDDDEDDGADEDVGDDAS